MATCIITTSVNTNVKNTTVYAVAFANNETLADVKDFVRSKLYNNNFINRFPDTIIPMYNETTRSRFHSGRGNETFRGQLSKRAAQAGRINSNSVVVSQFAGDSLVSDTHIYIVLVDGIHKTNISVTKIFTGGAGGFY